MCHCECESKVPLPGLDLSVLIGFFWFPMQVGSIVNELPSCSDADCSLEPMSDPEEEEDMPDDKDPSRSEGR